VRRQGLGQPKSRAEQDRHEVDQELGADAGASHDAHVLAVGGFSCLSERVLDAGS
jgi:hypothetical protein